jgi:hypothetical protein
MFRQGYKRNNPRYYFTQSTSVVISSAWRTVDNEQHDAAIRRDPSAIKGGNDLLALNGWKGERQQIIVGHGGRGVLRFWPKVGFSNQILRHIDDDPGELWHALVGRPARLFETSAAPQCAWPFTRLQRRVARHRLGGSFLLGRLAGAHAVEFEHRVPRLGLDEEVRQCPNKRVNAVW